MLCVQLEAAACWVHREWPVPVRVRKWRPTSISCEQLALNALFPSVQLDAAASSSIQQHPAACCWIQQDVFLGMWDRSALLSLSLASAETPCFPPPVFHCVD